MILGIAFTDMEITRIETNNRQIVPGDGHEAAIVESSEDEDVVQLTSDAKTKDDEASKHIRQH